MAFEVHGIARRSLDRVTIYTYPTAFYVLLLTSSYLSYLYRRYFHNLCFSSALIFSRAHTFPPSTLHLDSISRSRATPQQSAIKPRLSPTSLPSS